MQRSHLIASLGALSIFSIVNLGSAFNPATAPPGCGDDTECSITGGSWKTVDTYSVSPANSWVSGAASTSKAVFIVGESEPGGDGGDSRWITRRSRDRGNTWTTVDTYTTHPDQQFGAIGIAADARNGHVYAVGGAQSQTSAVEWQPWVVRKSTNDGDTWKNVDNFNLARNFVGPRAIAIDGEGVIYVAGTTVEFNEDFGEAGRHGVLRRSADGGATWTTQHFHEFEFLSAVAASENGTVFVSGAKIAPPVGGHVPWLIKTSTTGTGGWTLAKELPEGFNIKGLRTHSDGRVIAFGSALNGDSFYWTTLEARISAPTAWTEIDRYQPLDFSAGFGDAEAVSATFAKSGVIYASGSHAHPARTDVEFVTREGNVPESNFWEVDRMALYPRSDGIFGVTSASTTTPQGDIITVHQKPGNFTTGAPGAWIVRKLECK